MIDQIYVETAVAEHPRTTEILRRFPNASVVSCEHYGQVFNRKAQNFRVQKQRPALMLARKTGNAVLPAPDGYGIGGDSNFYFSHMLNCLYDCRYCFLQGMYRSASYVVFVNYEEILQQIETTAEQHCERRQQWFFSGYDCDSLAMEPVTRFMQTAIPFFAERGSLNLEIRTKSTQVRSLLDADPIPNCVVAMSFTPDVISRQLEHKVPSVGKRVAALQKLQRRGWQVGLRFDPVIYAENYLCQYRQLFDDIFAQLDADAIHSVSLGAFRLPRGYFRSLVKLYPREKLFASGQLQDDSVVSYRPELEQQMMASIRKLLGEYLHEEKLFTCDWQG